MVNKNGPEIAPPNTFTDDWDWRYQLTAEDMIDAVDSEVVWYKSTCLDNRAMSVPQIDPESHNDKLIRSVEALVGFRIYEDEGHKVDDDGRKFTGWSNKYDDWVTVTSPTI